MSGFQRQVNQQPAPGVEGDFSSTNPRASVVPAIAGAWKVAPGQDVRVGYFAWGAIDGLVYSSAAAAEALGAAVLGFVGRQANTPAALITEFLGEEVMTLQEGREVTLFDSGDFWANFAAGATPGQNVHAVAATGQPTTSSSGNPESRYLVASVAKAPAVTAATTTIAAETGVMTVLTVASGVIEAGQRVTGAGVEDETYVTAQLTGTAGGAGTYQTTSVNRAAVAAFTATMVQGTLAKISANWTSGATPL